MESDKLIDTPVNSKVKLEEYLNYSLVDVVADKIRENIFSGRYVPGQKLVVREISEGLGVSHTPVKDALNRLVSEGCVVSSPRRSMTVKEYSNIEFIENYEIRMMLELYYSDEIVEYVKSSKTILDNMYRYGSEMDEILKRGTDSFSSQWANRETDFHREYMKACGNKRVYDIYCGLNSNRQSYYQYLGNNGQPLSNEFLHINNEEHWMIIQALTKQDVSLFSETVYSHLIRSCESYVIDEASKKRFHIMKSKAEGLLKKK